MKTKKQKKQAKKGKELTVSELAAMGGKARAAALTPERRREISRQGNAKRWPSTETKP